MFELPKKGGGKMELKLSAFLTQLCWLLGDLPEQDKQEIKEFPLDFASNEPQAQSRIDRFPDDERAMASCCPHCKQIKLPDTAKHGGEGGGAVAKLARDISSPQQEPLDIDPKRTSKLG